MKLRWPFARKSTYDDILATYQKEWERVVAERDEVREALDEFRADLERRRRPRFLTGRAGQPGTETHPDLFPPDDRPVSVWMEHPDARAVWIPIGPFTLNGKEYQEGFVQKRRPEPDPRLEYESVTLWEGFDLVPSEGANQLDWYGAMSVPPEPPASPK